MYHLGCDNVIFHGLKNWFLSFFSWITRDKGNTLNLMSPCPCPRHYLVVWILWWKRWLSCGLWPMRKVPEGRQMCFYGSALAAIMHAVFCCKLWHIKKSNFSLFVPLALLSHPSPFSASGCAAWSYAEKHKFNITNTIRSALSIPPPPLPPILVHPWRRCHLRRVSKVKSWSREKEVVFSSSVPWGVDNQQTLLLISVAGVASCSSTWIITFK